MYEVLTVDNKEWSLNVQKLIKDNIDAYYCEKYYKMYEVKGDGIGKLFIYKENNNVVLYPFMVNKINGYNLKKDYYDIETAYGYGGPISNCYNKVFLERFEQNFLEYCNKNNIIAEFIRFNPLISNENMFKENIEVIENRTTVLVNLEESLEYIWNKQLKSTTRNRIRKAKKNGLYVEQSTDIDTFKNLYKQTMDKVNANKYYYFNDEYFEQVESSEFFKIFNVKKDDKTIASSIFMGYGNFFHYHLGGSCKEYLKLAPNNLFFWEAIKFAKEKGYKKVHFGGGLSNSKNDNLFKFKSGFSKTYSKFYIGKRIHNKRIYNFIIDKWENDNNKKADKLLQYKI